MPVIKIVTINILSDLSRWTERRSLLTQGLASIEPDLIAIQELQVLRIILQSREIIVPFMQQN